MTDTASPPPAAAIDLPWDDIDTILLDMDGTLLDLYFDNHFWTGHLPKRFGEQRGISRDQAWAQIAPQMQAVRGTLDWYSIHYWSRWLDIDVPALKREVAHLIQPRPGVFRFLGDLKNTGKTIVLATNAHPDTLELKFARVALGNYFDQQITSHELGAVKESPEFWDALSHHLDFNPGRSLLIDDHPGVLWAAGQFGIAHLFGILKPDLQKPDIRPNGFVLLESFEQISGGL